jgi:uncharacterized membrane protein YqiK
MNNAPMSTDPAANPKRTRRTPQQQLAAAELQVQRARTRIAKETGTPKAMRSKASVAAKALELEALRVRLAGEWLLARSDVDAHAFGVLAELKRSLKAPEALEAFAD